MFRFMTTTFAILTLTSIALACSDHDEAATATQTTHSKFATPAAHARVHQQNTVNPDLSEKAEDELNAPKTAAKVLGTQDESQPTPQIAKPSSNKKTQTKSL